MARRLKEIIEFKIPADPQCVPVVRKAVQCIASNLGFSEQTASDIELSVAEAITNSVQHGSPHRRNDTVMVVCRLLGDQFVIEIEDQGPGFRLPGRNEGWEVFSEGGRGLKLVQQLMDGVEVALTGQGCKLTMCKKHHHPQLQPAR